VTLLPSTRKRNRRNSLRDVFCCVLLWVYKATMFSEMKSWKDFLLFLVISKCFDFLNLEFYAKVILDEMRVIQLPHGLRGEFSNSYNCLLRKYIALRLGLFIYWLVSFLKSYQVPNWELENENYWLGGRIVLNSLWIVEREFWSYPLC